MCLNIFPLLVQSDSTLKAKSEFCNEHFYDLYCLLFILMIFHKSVIYLTSLCMQMIQHSPVH